MSDIENLRTVRQSLVVRRRDLASRGAMSPADGGRSATQIRSLQSEIEAIDQAIADEVKAEGAAATPAWSRLPVNGQRVSFAENVFYEFRDGRIAQVWSIIDKSGIEAQL